MATRAGWRALVSPESASDAHPRDHFTKHFGNKPWWERIVRLTVADDTDGAIQ